MAKNAVNEWDSNPDGNTDVGGVSIAEGCPPGNINNAIRMVMAQIKTYATSVTATLATKANTADVTTATTNAAPPATIQDFMRKSVPEGWIKASGTIGNGSSGGTRRANADCLNLFTVLWNDFNNSELTIQTSAGANTIRGATALDDFNAGKRMPVYDLRTLFRRAPDDGLGYDATLVPGLTQTDSIKSHVHTGTTSVAGNHTHGSTISSGSGGNRITGGANTPIGNDPNSIAPAGDHAHTFTTDSTGGSETRPRAFVALVCIKL